MVAGSALAGALFVVTSCLPSIDLTGKACPCTSDFTCDLATNRCVAPGSVPASNDATPGANDVPDGATDGDGGVDAAPVPGSFCAGLSPRPTFCSDFETLLAPWGWDRTSSNGGGQLNVDAVSASASARSAFFVLPAVGSAANGTAALLKTFSVPVTSLLTINLDLSLETIDAEVPVVLVHIDGTDATYDLFLGVQKGRARILEETKQRSGGAVTYGGGDLSQPLPLGGWSHVSWTITASATSSTSNVAVERDGGTISTGLTGLGIYHYPVPPRISVGVPYLVAPPSAGWRVRADNVVVDIH